MRSKDAAERDKVRINKNDKKKGLEEKKEQGREIHLNCGTHLLLDYTGIIYCCAFKTFVPHVCFVCHLN